MTSGPATARHRRLAVLAGLALRAARGSGSRVAARAGTWLRLAARAMLPGLLQWGLLRIPSRPGAAHWGLMMASALLWGTWLTAMMIMEFFTGELAGRPGR